MTLALAILAGIAVLLACRCFVLYAELESRTLERDTLKETNALVNSMLVVTVGALRKSRLNELVTSLENAGLRIIVDRYERGECERKEAITRG